VKYLTGQKQDYKMNDFFSNRIRLLLLTLVFSGLSLSAQTKKDTVYILFDSIHKTMRMGSGFKESYNKISKQKEKAFHTLFMIREKETPNYEMYDTWYHFSHIQKTQSEIEAFDLKDFVQPSILFKEKSFMDKIDLLDYNFFANTDYNKVCKTFEAEDSGEQDVVIYVIDVADIKNDSIKLIEVKFRRPTKE